MPAKNVLVIEDNEDMADLLSLDFKAAGFNVMCVGDTLPGMKEIVDFKPNIIILDLMLPSGKGVGLLQLIRLSPSTEKIPVIVYTGMNDENQKQEIENIGVEAYILKPSGIKKVVEKAQALLDQLK